MRTAAIADAQSPAAKWRARAMFLIRKFVIGYRITGEPHFDREATACFKSLLARSSRYLEYGSGGSTILAWQSANVVVTVDNDRRFLRALTRTLLQSARKPDLFRLIHADTGITLRWGVPVFRTPTPARLSRWQHYAKAPWEFLRAPRR